MGADRAAPSSSVMDRTPSLQRSRDSERPSLDPPHRGSLEGSTAQIWPLADGPRTLQFLAPRRSPWGDQSCASGGAELPRRDRLVTVVCGRDQHSSFTGGLGRSEKGGPEEEPDDHALGRSRGGFGTKIHLVTDGQGVPLGAAVTAGQRHELKGFEPALGTVLVRSRSSGRHRRTPDAIACDKAYSHGPVRRWLHRRKIEPVIPNRRDQVERRRKGGCRKFDPEKYRRRNTVERCVGWIKECRRVATRFEKLAVNYAAMINLAIIERLLRLLTKA